MFVFHFYRISIIFNNKPHAKLAIKIKNKVRWPAANNERMLLVIMHASEAVKQGLLFLSAFVRVCCCVSDNPHDYRKTAYQKLIRIGKNVLR